MASPITHCLDRLNLGDNEKVKRRAEEFSGQLSTLPAKLFDKGPNSKPVIAIQLAYESLQNYDWDTKLAAQLAGCTLSAYESALSKARQQLNIQPNVSFDSLAVALGSTTMLNPAKELYMEFEKLYLESSAGARKRTVQKEFEKPCWKGAIMFACAKAFGDNLAKDRLHSLCGCTTTELNKCIKIVQSTCEKKISELKSTSTKAARSRRTKKTQEESADEEEPKETEAKTKTKKKAVVSSKRKQEETTDTITKKKAKPPISGIVSMINHQDYTKTKRYADYVKWKDGLLVLLATPSNKI